MNIEALLKFFIVSILLCISAIHVNGQDTLVTIRKKKIPAKVVEINSKDVKYKKFSDLSGPAYTIPRVDLIKIVYANGVVDTFNYKLIMIPEPVIISLPPAMPDPRSTDYFRNFVYITATDLLMGIFTVGYEYTLKTGKTSWRIPLSLGLSNLGITNTTYDNKSPMAPALPSGAYYFSNKIFSTGVELSFFPQGQGTIKYFWGPTVAYGLYNYYLYDGVESQPGTFVIQKQTSSMFTIMIKNGVLFQPTKKFNISGFLGFGLDNLTNKSYSSTGGNYYYSDGILRYFTTEIGINVGYKFK